MNNKKMYVIASSLHVIRQERLLMPRCCSSTTRKLHTNACSMVIRSTQRYCSSWDGFTISKAAASRARRELLNTSSNLLQLVSILQLTWLRCGVLTRSTDNSDAQSWYLLGRCYMSQQKYPKAYEAYQQAVYRDGRNPTFWCSIGVLYYQINQYRDALDAYSRAIRLNPYLSEVWYDLGTLVSSKAWNSTHDCV